MKEKDNYARYLFHLGENMYSYNYLGCNKGELCDRPGYFFRTWAPNADAVSLVSEFTDWDSGVKMTKEDGIWETFIPTDSSLEGKKYKFLITRGDKSVYKGDPYALSSVGFDDGASVVYCERNYRWKDSNWLKERTMRKKGNDRYISSPINIYEVHLGSFKRTNDGRYMNYREIGEILLRYLKYMGFTHVEFLPIYEHPYDGSWGYQVGAFFAPTSRFGTPDDLKYMINLLHEGGIGVIFDWVCAHFPKDEWGLYEYDGSPLYEYQGEDRKESRSWGTRFFDLGREQVRSFLISNALYYFREYHIDGLRVDAVASMIYLDYDRMPGEWIPNHEGGISNKEAEWFLKRLSCAIFKEFPSALMIAEESGDRGKITHPAENGGLGFNLKWNMGFANDIYEYIATDAEHRKFKHTALTFPLIYAFSENYILPISHDEVVHGKLSLINKANACYEDKFSTMRLLLLTIMTYPGKKLSFMGYEFAQFREWNFDGELEWFMLGYDKHREMREYVRALNHFYLYNESLWYDDFKSDGFNWLSVDESDKCSVAFIRRSNEEMLIVALNYSDREQSLAFSISESKKIECVFETSFAEKEILTATDEGIFNISLPRFSGKVFKPIKSRKILL